MDAKIWIKTPPEKVYPAVSDLTHHAKWAAHPIKIESLDSVPVKVGSKYKSQHAKFKNPDVVTVTELVPNQRFGFRAVMPNKLEIQHAMSLSPQDGGTQLMHSAKLVKGPPLLFFMARPMVALISTLAPGAEKKFLNNLKTELEQSR